MSLKFVITEDGSHSLFVPELNEHYHSVFGAINESQHIFIDAGLKKAISNKREINILEIGYGTGLNALMTFIELERQHIKCDYTAIEAFPLDMEIYSQLNYSEILKISNDIFLKIHEVEWGVKQIISDFFKIQKLESKVQEMSLPENNFDLVFFDAFAPDVQPELWTTTVFENIHHSMKNEAILTTYSTKGIVKRALKAAGFSIEKLPGPKGKREILRATK